jgi:hypothetical protein
MLHFAIWPLNSRLRYEIYVMASGDHKHSDISSLLDGNKGGGDHGHRIVGDGSVLIRLRQMGASLQDQLIARR